MQYENLQGIFTYQYDTDSTIAITGYVCNHRYVKIPDEIGKSLMNMKEPDSSVLIKRLEEYIKEHPEELEFIELKEMEK